MRPRASPLARLRTFVAAPIARWMEHREERRIGGAREGWRAPLPVIAVEGAADIALPGALAVIGRLQSRGIAPVVLLQAPTPAPVRVDPRKHGYETVGGAALLAASFAPTWVAADMADGARAAINHSQENGEAMACLVALGGARERNIAADLTVAVIDAVSGPGNRRHRLARPWIAAVTPETAQAEIGLVIGDPAARDRFNAGFKTGLPRQYIHARMEILPTGMDWHGLRVLAVSGTRQARDLFAALPALGAKMVRAVTLPGQAPPARVLVSRLRREAAALGAQLVTTEADALCLPDDLRREVLVLPLRLTVAQWGPFDAALERLGLG